MRGTHKTKCILMRTLKLMLGERYTGMAIPIFQINFVRSFNTTYRLWYHISDLCNLVDIHKMAALPPMRNDLRSDIQSFGTFLEARRGLKNSKVHTSLDSFMKKKHKHVWPAFICIISRQSDLLYNNLFYHSSVSFYYECQSILITFLCLLIEFFCF